MGPLLAGGGGRALRRLLGGAKSGSAIVRVFYTVVSGKVSQVDTPYPCPHAPSFCTTPTPRIAIHAVTPHTHLRIANCITLEPPECSRTKRRGVFPRPHDLDAQPYPFAYGAFLGAFSVLIINSREKHPLRELELGGW